MSSIQQVLNSTDMRRKIFNFNTQEKMIDMFCGYKLKTFLKLIIL